MKNLVQRKDYTSPDSSHLEPRVAKLELGMERLTDDVQDLAQVVRNQGSRMEGEIQKLVVAVTQASGPRKTDWSTIIAAVMLIMAIGSAAFWPLNQTVQENKESIKSIESAVVEHSKSANHPVGSALQSRLEEQLKEHAEQGDKNHENLRQHFHDEIELITKTYELQLNSVQDKVNLINDRLFQRIVKLEEQQSKDVERDRDELREWRKKAMD